MPLYEYRCPDCSNRSLDQTRDNRLRPPGGCSVCGAPELRRVFGFALKPMMHEHFNHTTGQVVSDMRQFQNQLNQMSDEATERTGIAHKYVATERDPQNLGVTNHGIDEANRGREKAGEPLLPTIPGV